MNDIVEVKGEGVLENIMEAVIYVCIQHSPSVIYIYIYIYIYRVVYDTNYVV
jgi:hypothetical protein